MGDTDFQMTDEEFRTLYAHFREARHDINNNLAVLLAQAEMSQLKPAYLEKLASTVMERGPQILSLLAGFQAALAAKLPPPAANPPASEG